MYILRTLNLVMELYERNHEKKWWDLSKEERDAYFERNRNRALMLYYKKKGVVRLRLICSKRDITKFGSNNNRIAHFENYLRTMGIHSITFPYSSKEIGDTTFNLEIPYEKYKKFMEQLSYFEITDIELI